MIDRSRCGACRQLLGLRAAVVIQCLNPTALHSSALSIQRRRLSRLRPLLFFFLRSRFALQSAHLSASCMQQQLRLPPVSIHIGRKPFEAVSYCDVGMSTSTCCCWHVIRGTSHS